MVGFIDIGSFVVVFRGMTIFKCEVADEFVIVVVMVMVAGFVAEINANVTQTNRYSYVYAINHNVLLLKYKYQATEDFATDLSGFDNGWRCRLNYCYAFFWFQ